MILDKVYSKFLHIHHPAQRSSNCQPQDREQTHIVAWRLTLSFQNKPGSYLNVQRCLGCAQWLESNKLRIQNAIFDNLCLVDYSVVEFSSSCSRSETSFRTRFSPKFIILSVKCLSASNSKQYFVVFGGISSQRDDTGALLLFFLFILFERQSKGTDRKHGMLVWDMQQRCKDARRYWIASRAAASRTICSKCLLLILITFPEKLERF